MKKFAIFFLIFILAVALISGGVLYFSYQHTTDESVPSVTLTVQDEEFTPNKYSWHEPLIAGIMEKDFSYNSGQPNVLGILNAQTLPLTLSQDYNTYVTLQKNNQQIWSGTLAEWNEYHLSESGNYALEILVTAEKYENKIIGYGTFLFNFTFEIQLEPELYSSGPTVAQGDVLAIVVKQIENEEIPTIETDLDMTGKLIFTQSAPGEMSVFIPVTYNREIGDYIATVILGDYTWQVPYTVVATEYARQDLTIDTSDPVISEANSAKAYQQYRDVIYPFFETADPTRYWQGIFEKPAQAELSTEYALRRYTNGSTTPSRHVGLDIAADADTPVIAPNNGKVVLAENLLNTGNTLVIEYGGGLKSYFFHMNALSVSEGDLVTKGQEVGLVGSTGYSTGPHLHFEVRIGNQSINPAWLYEGSSNLFFTPTQENKVQAQ